MISCTEQELPPVAPDPDPEGSITVDDRLQTRGVQNGSYNSLGVSYDVGGGYLNDKATKVAVIDVAAYVADNPDALIVNSTTYGDTRYYYGADAEEYSKFVKTSTSLNAKIDILKVDWLPSGNFSYSGDVTSTSGSTVTFSTKYSYARADLIRQVKSYKLEAVRRRRPTAA